MSELSRHTETFIVRIWVEYLGQTPPIWRGQIEHVGDNEVAHFGNLREMNEWIERCVEMQRHTREQEENDESKRKRQECPPTRVGSLIVG